jgi:BCCT family betaine/carnitine transporter
MSGNTPIEQANSESGTDYEIGQDNVEIFGLDMHHPVFPVSAVLIVAFVVITLLFPKITGAFFEDLRVYVTTTFDWVFVVSVNIILLFCGYLVVSKYGSIRIGGEHAVPDFGYPAFLAMLFAAGMGIGLMFYGVLEPMNHTLNPPLGIDPADIDAARSAGMSAAIFHWGLHAWAIYAVVALALAFFCYNRGLPLTLRSAFQPLFGDAAWGWLGHTIDTLAVFATIFGLATSLGLGAGQIAGGLNYLFDVAVTDTLKVTLIVGIIGIALFSVVAGMDKGVRRLSELNMILAALLLVFVLIVGPTLAIGRTFLDALISYPQYLPGLSNWIGREDTAFYHDWTTFYWAWWISWSPFVGMFIARISRGRTIRVLVVSALLIPTLVCVLWMSTFGGTAVDQMFTDGYMGVRDTITSWRPELSLYRMAENLPLASLVSMLGVILVVIFFVTSADSGSLVIDTMTAGGKMDAPTRQRVFWCSEIGLVAIALMLGGGLGGLQALVIAFGLPFTVVLLVMLVSLLRGLREELR